MTQKTPLTRPALQQDALREIHKKNAETRKAALELADQRKRQKEFSLGSKKTSTFLRWLGL